MKTYIIFIVLLAVIIPLTVKLTIASLPTGGANTEPCMINLQSDNNLELDTPVQSKPMRLQQEINTPANETVQKINPFANTFDNASMPSDTQIEDDSDITNQKRMGQKCEFGLCLPGK